MYGRPKNRLAFDIGASFSRQSMNTQVPSTQQTQPQQTQLQAQMQPHDHTQTPAPLSKSVPPGMHRKLPGPLISTNDKPSSHLVTNLNASTPPTNSSNSHVNHQQLGEDIPLHSVSGETDSSPSVQQPPATPAQTNMIISQMLGGYSDDDLDDDDDIDKYTDDSTPHNQAFSPSTTTSCIENLTEISQLLRKISAMILSLFHPPLSAIVTRTSREAYSSYLLSSAAHVGVRGDIADTTHYISFRPFIDLDIPFVEVSLKHTSSSLASHNITKCVELYTPLHGWIRDVFAALDSISSILTFIQSQATLNSVKFNGLLSDKQPFDDILRVFHPLLSRFIASFPDVLRTTLTTIKHTTSSSIAEDVSGISTGYIPTSATVPPPPPPPPLRCPDVNTPVSRAQALETMYSSLSLDNVLDAALVSNPSTALTASTAQSDLKPAQISSSQSNLCISDDHRTVIDGIESNLPTSLKSRTVVTPLQPLQPPEPPQQVASNSSGSTFSPNLLSQPNSLKYPSRVGNIHPSRAHIHSMTTSTSLEDSGNSNQTTGASISTLSNPPEESRKRMASRFMFGGLGNTSSMADRWKKIRSAEHGDEQSHRLFSEKSDNASASSTKPSQIPVHHAQDWRTRVVKARKSASDDESETD